MCPGPPLPAPATEFVFEGTRSQDRSRCPLQGGPACPGEVGRAPDLGLYPQKQENEIPATVLLLPCQTHVLEERIPYFTFLSFSVIYKCMFLLKPIS